MNNDAMTEAEAEAIDLRIAASLEGQLCSDCPGPQYPNATTRCLPCPRRPENCALKTSEASK